LRNSRKYAGAVVEEVGAKSLDRARQCAEDDAGCFSEGLVQGSTATGARQRGAHSDVSKLIDYLYISRVPLCCSHAANVDAQGSVDISDLTQLIDHLYLTFAPMSPCSPLIRTCAPGRLPGQAHYPARVTTRHKLLDLPPHPT
jgi:hypothetical protein